MFKQSIVILLLSLNLSTPACENSLEPKYKPTTIMLSPTLQEEHSTQTESLFDEMVRRISRERASVGPKEDFDFPNNEVVKTGCCALS